MWSHRKREQWSGSNANADNFKQKYTNTNEWKSSVVVCANGRNVNDNEATMKPMELRVCRMRFMAFYFHGNHLLCSTQPNDTTDERTAKQLALQRDSRRNERNENGNKNVQTKKPTQKQRRSEKNK